ncbi:hypothetical protein THC_0938 [Caldimicrobium thiodismutans]|uniref:histidine kinase n=1 Tax=Caldimicrobium thiodismutans TaxID=1653476 RepID=A0A0U4W2L6_9BACT|nr:HAMP domain-containing sensor histidine kinase [Caldimicrobium thiodismutans]BAU23323.1 hypothetical protein THC_0938 [Caldimicrobium thiodismutans]
MSDLTLLLFFLLLFLFILGITLYKKNLKLRQELSRISQLREVFSKALHEIPTEIILLHREEIFFINKKALENFGANPRLSDLIKGINKGGRRFKSLEIPLGKDYKMLVFMDITEIESYKEAYQMALSYLSHELKTPLAVAKGYLERLEDKIALSLEERDRESFEKAKEAFEKLEKLLKKLFSSIEYLAKEIRFKREAVNLRECLEEAIFWVSPLAEDKGINIERKIPEDIFLKGSSELLTQAFFNVIENAVKVTPDGGKVEIKVYEVSSEIVSVAIRDYGPGVPPEKLPLLAMPFFKLREGEGMGLGLFITRRIIEAHGGAIKFSLPEGGGLIVEIDLKRI